MIKSKKYLKLTAFIFCMAIVSFTALNVKAFEMPPAIVKIEKIQKAKYFQENKYIGRVEAIEEVQLQARVEGEILDIKFTEGEFVKKNDLLFQIEDIKYKAQVEAAKAQVEMAQAKIIQNETNVIFAQKDLKRQKKLQEKNVVSMQLLEDAQLKKEVAVAQLREAAANLALAEATLQEKDNLLSYTKIYAPITGMIGKINISTGNIVNTSSPSLAYIVQLDPIRISFSISETEFLNMFGSDKEFKKHAKISVLLADGNKYQFEAIPDFIDNKVDKYTNTIKIWTKIKNNDLILKPGGFVSLYVSNSKSKNYLKFPVNALRTDNKGNFIYIVNKKSEPIKKHITVAGASAGYIFIEGTTLKAGDLVITEGMHKIFPQTKKVMTREQLIQASQQKAQGTKKPTKNKKETKAKKNSK